MATVMLMTDDDEYLGWAARELGTVGHRVLEARRIEVALGLLERADVDVVVVDSSLPSGQSERLAGYVNVRDGNLPLVTVTSGDRPVQTGLSSTRSSSFAVPKRRETGLLARTVASALADDTGFWGSVHSVSLLDLLQLMHIGRRTVRIRVSADLIGSIDLVTGEVVDARYGSLEGVPALAAMLAQARGSLETTTARGGSRTVDRPFEALLIDVMRQLDEGLSPEAIAVRRSTRPPPAWLAMAVEAPTKADETPRVDASRRADGLEAACRTIVAQRAGTVACGLVDVESGLLVGYAEDDAWPDAIALAQRAASLLRRSRGDAASGNPDADLALTEFVLTSERSRQFSRSLRGGSAALVLLMPRSSSLEAGWSALEAAENAVETAAS